MTTNFTKLDVGPRVAWWVCRNGCGVVEWHEDSGEPQVCPRCGADSDDGQSHGVYTVASVGGEGVPWRVVR